MLNSKSFVAGVRTGKVIKSVGKGITAGVREIGSAFKWIGGEVAKDSRNVASGVADFGRGFKRAVTEG